MQNIKFILTSGKRKWYFFLFLLLTLLFFFLSVNKGSHASKSGDYNIYYQAGKDFIVGGPIYTPGLIDGGFVYPPFAAMLYGLFAMMPLGLSAFLYCYLINYGLWIFSFVLIRKIVQLFYPEQNYDIYIFLGFLCSFRFYWHNFIWLQGNMPVLCFTLAGILFFMRKKYNLAYIFFLAGCFFKITPIIFLFFAAIKRGPKDWPKVILFSLPFIFVPFIFRGILVGVNDWLEYYEAFIAPFGKGQIDENIISLGLPSLLSKINMVLGEKGAYNMVNLSNQNLKNLVRLIQISITALLLLMLLYNKIIKKNDLFSASELCLIFLATLLLPGRVWEHHHVSTGFIYTCVFINLIRARENKKFYALATICLLIGLIGRDIVGDELYAISQYYSFVTWLMVLISIILVRLMIVKDAIRIQQN